MQQNFELKFFNSFPFLDFNPNVLRATVEENGIYEQINNSLSAGGQTTNAAKDERHLFERLVKEKVFGDPEVPTGHVFHRAIAVACRYSDYKNRSPGDKGRGAQRKETNKYKRYRRK